MAGTPARECFKASTACTSDLILAATTRQHISLSITTPQSTFQTQKLASDMDPGIHTACSPGRSRPQPKGAPRGVVNI